MAKWAALVYGRTYEVDFRFLALPEDFRRADRDREWVEDYILATTREPEKLAAGPRWALFQNERYCVVGVACMAHDLVGTQDTDGKDITHDSKGRPLYLFAGYVAKRDSAQPSVVPSIEPRLDIFRPLCEQVRARWQDKYYDEVKSTISSYKSVEALDQKSAEDAKSAEDTKSVEDAQSVEDTQSVENTKSAENIKSAEDTQSAQDMLPSIVLNTHPDYVFLWPEQERTTVWQVATLYAQKSARMSVCLGLPSQKEAIEGPFFNGTSSDVQKETKLECAVSSKPSADAVAKANQKPSKAKSKSKPAAKPSSSQARKAKGSGASASGDRKTQSTTSDQPSPPTLEEYWHQILNGKVDTYLREVGERVRQGLGKSEKVKWKHIYWQALESAYANGQAGDRERLERVRKSLRVWKQDAKKIERQYQRAKYREAIEMAYAGGEVDRETLEKERQRFRLSGQEAKRIEQEYLYWQSLESAYADGQVDADGRKRLEKVQKHLGLSRQDAKRIEREYRRVNANRLADRRGQLGSGPIEGLVADIGEGINRMGDFFDSLLGFREVPPQKKSAQAPHDKRQAPHDKRQAPRDKRQAPADQRPSLYGSFKKKESKESKEGSDKKDDWF